MKLVVNSFLKRTEAIVYIKSVSAINNSRRGGCWQEGPHSRHVLINVIRSQV